MTNTLLDLSQRHELGLHAEIVVDVEAAAMPLGIVPLIVGAFARDVHLFYGHGIQIQRETEDIDFALALPDWTAFTALKDALHSSGAFRASPAAHRLRHRNGLPVDLVPFGAIEDSGRKISWPPKGEVVMDVFGFREALDTAQEVVLPGNVRTRVVSLSALALLKIVCWQERHYASPRKDAQDLYLIMSTYLDAGNGARLWEEFVDWTQDTDFEYELAGPRMLGHDIRGLLRSVDIERVTRLLHEQVDAEAPGLLPNEMNRNDPDRARALLRALLDGLVGKDGHRSP